VNSSFLAKWMAIAVLSAAGVGCKQQSGERCQVSADCDDGLTCSQAEPKTCGGLNQQQVDAYTPAIDPDAFVVPPEPPSDVPGE
jgi:hypothetical protein